MALRNTSQRFGAVAQSLHWIVVVGIIAQYIIVELAEEAEHGGGGSEADLMLLHRSIGLTILLLAAVRLIWRFVDRRPAWPATMARAQRAVATGAHAALYALIVAVPLSGWALASAEGDRIEYFGWFEVPAIVAGQAVSQSEVADDEEAEEEEIWEERHETLFNVLVLFAVLHALAGLKHHFWDKDNVLRSMLPEVARRN